MVAPFGLKHGWFLNQLIKRLWPRNSRVFSQKAWFQHLLLCRDFGVRLASVPTGGFPRFPKPNQKSPPKEIFYTSPQSHRKRRWLFQVLMTIFFAKIYHPVDFGGSTPPSTPSLRIRLQDFVGDSRPPSGLFWSDTLSSKPSKAVPAATTVNPLRCGVGLFGDGRKHQWTYILNKEHMLGI